MFKVLFQNSTNIGVFSKKSLVDVARPFFLQNDENLPKNKNIGLESCNYV
jgi:hypothetical protein